MQYALRFFTILMLCMVMFCGWAQAGSQPPSEGGVMPEIVLSVPQNSEHQVYLGVIGKNTFSLPEITAEVLIIEIFSMY